MEKLIDFITNNPSYAIIILLVLYIILEKLGIVNVMNIIRGTQIKKYPELKNEHLEIMEELHKQNKVLSAQNEKFATNHSMHEIPDIKVNVEKINDKLDRFLDVQIDQGKEIAKHGEAITFLKRHVGIKE